MRGNLAPSREAGERTSVCPTLRAGGNRTGGDRPPGTDVDTCESLIVAHTLRAEGFDASEDGTGRGTPLVPVAVPLQEVGKRTGVSTTDPRAGIGIGVDGDPMFTLQAGAQHGVAIAAPVPIQNATRGKDQNGTGPQALVQQPYTLAIRGRGDSHDLEYRQDGTANALLTPNGGRGGIGVGAIHCGMQVRRLTPVECSRLQGFPDDYLLQVPWRGKTPPPDGPMYKALGNSMAVPVMRWIGQQIMSAAA